MGYDLAGLAGGAYFPEVLVGLVVLVEVFCLGFVELEGFDGLVFYIQFLSRGDYMPLQLLLALDLWLLQT